MTVSFSLQVFFKLIIKYILKNIFKKILIIITNNFKINRNINDIKDKINEIELLNCVYLNSEITTNNEKIHWTSTFDGESSFG